MVHNGIEYGLMAAYAEGLNLLQNADAGTRERQVDAETAPIQDAEYYRYDIDLTEVAEVWRRGSGRLLLAARPDSRGVGRVSGPGRVRAAASRTRARG